MARSLTLAMKVRGLKTLNCRIAHSMSSFAYMTFVLLEFSSMLCCSFGMFNDDVLSLRQKSERLQLSITGPQRFTSCYQFFDPKEESGCDASKPRVCNLVQAY